MTEPSRVTFKLFGSKRPAIDPSSSKNSVVAAEDDDNNNNNNQRQLITSIVDGQIEESTRNVTKTELIIPSQPNVHDRYFKQKLAERTKDNNSLTISETANSLEDEARRALIIDAQKANESWNDRNENGSIRVRTIEQNANDSKLNAPIDVENADYDQVPIEDFGMAVLRGMGYKEDSGVGLTNRKQTDIFVPEVRPRGLGLGADRKILEKINKLKRNLKDAGIDEKDDLCYEKGAYVLIEKGPHRDLYGTIESIDEDIARLTVSLAVGGTNRKKEVISISQYNAKLVTEKEFLKYSKYVNKSKADEVEKETSDKLMKDYQHSSNRDRDRDREHKHHRRSSDRHKHRHDDSERSRKH